MLNPTTRRLVAALLLGPGLAIAGVVANVATAKADVIQEDDPRWDCRTMGDLVCGPTNSQGVAPGLYAAGRLAQPWPTVTTCSPEPIFGVLLSCDTAPVNPRFVHLGGAR